MKKIILIIILLTYTLNALSQKSLLRGIWKGEITSDPVSNQVYIDIINQPNILSITLEKDKISVTDFNNVGEYFCICNNNKSILECSYPSFNWTDSSYFYTGTDVFEYYKIEYISNIIKLQLHRLSKQNNRNYLFDYLNLNLKIIKSKVILYSQPSQPTKMYLIQNDPVEVVEERDDWLKIKYYPEKNGEWTGKVIEGWIKKTDVE
jgi:hypothetical protein